MNSNLEKLKAIPYTVINDKALAHQDFLFKLIIIGDTGILILYNTFIILINDSRCWQELPLGKNHGQ